MKGIVRAIEEAQIKKGPHAGKPYFKLAVLMGPMHRSIVKTVVVIPNYDNQLAASVTGKYYRAEIEKYKAAVEKKDDFFGDEMHFDIVIVGDKSINPNDEPLPLYRTKDNDGKIRDRIHNTMKVIVETDEKGKYLESPRMKALQIIDQMCERVAVEENPTTMDSHESSSAPDPFAPQ